MDLYQLLRFLHFIGFIFIGGGLLAVFVSEFRGYSVTLREEHAAQSASHCRRTSAHVRGAASCRKHRRAVPRAVAISPQPLRPLL
jgi:hypothetical protein